MASLLSGRRHNSTTTNFEALPVDVATKILEFSPVSERLQLARCSTDLLRFITMDCASLWIEIDFSKEEWRKRDSISDSNLAGLLTRVNARNVTKRLNLGYCKNIKGSGLEPMRSSRVLEQVDVDYYQFEEQSDMIDILRTMIPHSLWQVRIGERQIEKPLIRRFLFDLHASNRQKAIESGAVCSGCPGSVADETTLVVPNTTGLPSTHCESCQRQYCRSVRCSVSVKDCSRCGSASCATCNVVARCDECNKSFCESCADISPPCRVCKKSLCGCRTYSFECDDCKTVICEECAGSFDNYCDRCNFCFCGIDGCRKVESCIMCETSLCYECSDGGLSNICAYCEHVYCDDHECGFTCTVCQGDFCFNCNEYEWCSCCEKRVCRECVADEDSGVDILICDGCMWEAQYCSECENLTACDSCDRRYCSECASKKCNVCSSALCYECNMDECFWCGNLLCNDCKYPCGGETISAFFHCADCQSLENDKMAGLDPPRKRARRS